MCDGCVEIRVRRNVNRQTQNVHSGKKKEGLSPKYIMLGDSIRFSLGNSLDLECSFNCKDSFKAMNYRVVVWLVKHSRGRGAG